MASYSFCGTHRPAETAAILLETATREGLPAELRLIAEDTATALANAGLHVTEDRDCFDYILDLAALAELCGNRLMAKRNAATRFTRTHPHRVHRLDPADPATRHTLLALRRSGATTPRNAATQLWSNGHDTDWPPLARLLSAAERFPLFILAITVADAIVAFYIAEPGQGGTVFGHFMRADHHAFPGSSVAIVREVARALLATGATRINCGSDDGLPGLRTNKLLYRPVGFVRKFTVRAEPGRS